MYERKVTELCFIGDWCAQSNKAEEASWRVSVGAYAFLTIFSCILNLRLTYQCSYDDGDTTLRKECPVADFVWSDKPLDILGSVTSMSFKDPACETMKNHALTTDEVFIFTFQRSSKIRLVLQTHTNFYIHYYRLNFFVKICVCWGRMILSIFWSMCDMIRFLLMLLIFPHLHIQTSMVCSLSGGGCIYERH